MESSPCRSVFQDIRGRELSGFRVRKRPRVADDSSEFNPIGGIAFEHEGSPTPPMALSFCKTSRNAHIAAVAGEDGCVSLYNTRLNFSSSATYEQNSDKATLCEWLAHDNAIFDVCWIKDDTNLLTACGDHSIKLWDTQRGIYLGALVGHTGSVKSVDAHPFNNDILVSGSRDGSFALWDLRCSKRRRIHFSTSPIAIVHGAHTSSIKTRARHGKAASMSITSVLYLKDGVSIATSGAVDSVVKFWDTRNLKAPVTQACPRVDPLVKWARSHGISSLSQDLNGVYISASCMDSRIHLYNVLQLDKGPIRSFSGSDISTFFVKSALSPDAGHILGGSSDGNAYVWQVNKPQADPIALKGHDGEVTAVDWCASETGKIATSSDDCTVRLWNINSCCYSNTRSPSSIRRRAMVLPKMECKRLVKEEEIKESTANGPQHASSVQIDSANPTSSKEMRTPVSVRSRTCETSPEATLGSPSSVLNPPPSSKRKTILDYFPMPS